MPLATIIIPYLEQSSTAESHIYELCQQSFTDMRYVLVKPQEVATPSALNTSVVVVESDVLTSAEAVNTAIEVVSGDYVGFFDPKDRWSAQKHVAHIAALEENPDIGLSFSGVTVGLPDRQRVQWQHNPRLTNISAAYVLKQNPIFAFSNIFARKEALETCSLMDEKTGAPQWCDPLAPGLVALDLALRMMTRTDWLVEGLPRALCEIQLDHTDMSPPDKMQILEWKRLIKSRAPMAPAFFARHAGAARKEFLKGKSAYLQPVMAQETPNEIADPHFMERTFSRAIRSDFKTRQQTPLQAQKSSHKMEKGAEKTP